MHRKTDEIEQNNKIYNENSGDFSKLPKQLISNSIFKLLPIEDLKSLRVANKRLSEISTEICQKQHQLFNNQFSTTAVKKGAKYFAVSNLSYSEGYIPFGRFAKDEKDLKRMQEEHKWSQKKEQLKTVHDATHFYLFKTFTEASEYMYSLQDPDLRDSSDYRMIVEVEIKQDTQLLIVQKDRSIKHELEHNRHLIGREINEAARSGNKVEATEKMEELFKITRQLKDPKNHIISQVFLRAEKRDVEIKAIYDSGHYLINPIVEPKVEPKENSMCHIF